MSLKWFHIVFVSLSMLVSIGFGIWGLLHDQLALGIASLAGSAGLCVYANYFIAKARSL